MQFQALSSRRYVCKTILGALGNGQHRRERGKPPRRELFFRQGLLVTGALLEANPSACLETSSLQGFYGVWKSKASW